MENVGPGARYSSPVKCIIILITLVISALIAAGCEKKPESVKIGYIGSLSGKYSVVGTNARNGAILAFEKANGEGGIAGRQVELLIRDDKGDPEKALAAAVEFEKMGIRFIVGPLLTASGTRIQPFITENEILTISGTTMGSNLEDQDDFFFKLNPSTRDYGAKIARFLLKKGYNKLGSISDSSNDPYCTTFMEGYAGPITESGSEHIPVIYNGRDNVNYSETASRLLKGRAEASLICANALDTALLGQHLKRIQPDMLLVSAPWGISDELIENGGSAIDGLYFFLSVIYGGQSARSKSFEDMFRSRFGHDANFAAIFNFEAMTMLITALRNNPGGTPAEIKKSILDTPLHRGVQEDFKLDPEGDPIKPFFLHRIENGQFMRVK